MTKLLPRKQYADISLATLLEETRINEEKLLRLQAMEMRLLSADSFLQVCQILVKDYQRQFKLQSVAVTLIDSGNQLKNLLLESERENGSDAIAFEDLQDNVFFINDYNSSRHLQNLPKVLTLGAYCDVYVSLFSNKHTKNINSVAILPLVRRNKLMGFLSLGSADPGRYTPDMAVDFIGRLASIVAICLQNAIHLERVKLEGLIDTLTRVRNRRYFFKRLDEEMMRAQRAKKSVFCMYIDLDHFKKINDKYGHTAGDIALIHSAKIMHNAVRESDVLARIGGEEFAVMLIDTHLEGAKDAAERILRAFREHPCELEYGIRLPLSVSIGLAECDAGQSIAEAPVLSKNLIKRADQALYRAKESGRNRLVTDAAMS